MSYSPSPLIDTSTSTKQNPDEDFFDIDPSAYPRAYLFLKAQRTILESLQETITQTKSMSNKTDRQTLSYLEFLVQNILCSTYGSVFPSAQNAIPALQDVLITKHSSPIVERIVNKILSATIALTKVFSMVSCSLSPINAVPVPIRDVEVDDTSSGPDTVMVLCRICEEYIPIDKIEAHSRRCVVAYESEYKIASTEDRIKKLQRAIQKSVLNSPWPGNQQDAVDFQLPMLHVVMLLDRALGTGSVQSDAEIVQLVFYSLNQITIKTSHMNVYSLLQKARELVHEKCSASSNLLRAQPHARRSNIGPSATTIADFEFIKPISSGAYARVFLARKTKSGDIYAIKVTPKSSLKQKNEVKRVLTEKDILLQNTNPFIVNFFYSIIGEHNLYLVMEFLPGGDLYSLLHNVGCLDEDSARIYTCQIVKALEYLHSNGIIHRDIKPDNMLITSTGQIKLTDFGLSLYGSVDRTIEPEIVGTPDYLAPEMILSQPHDVEVDFWSLGAVIFEFLTGIPPFHAETEEATFSRIVCGDASWEELEDVSKEAISLIRGLLTINPRDRLTLPQIKQHPWFKGIDWDHIEKLQAPFVPEVTESNPSTEYFTQRYEFQAEDSTIMADIEAATQAQPTPSPSFSTTPNSVGDDTVDEITEFPSISLQKLKEATAIDAQKRKRKRSSSAFEEALFLEEQEQSEQFPTSNSFATTDDVEIQSGHSARKIRSKTIRKKTGELKKPAIGSLVEFPSIGIIPLGL